MNEQVEEFRFSSRSFFSCVGDLLFVNVGLTNTIILSQKIIPVLRAKIFREYCPNKETSFVLIF